MGYDIKKPRRMGPTSDLTYPNSDIIKPNHQTKKRQKVFSLRIIVVILFALTGWGQAPLLFFFALDENMR
jgi:hypothetical protein